MGKRKYAWLPTRMSDGQVLWFESYWILRDGTKVRKNKLLLAYEEGLKYLRSTQKQHDITRQISSPPKKSSTFQQRRESDCDMTRINSQDLLYDTSRSDDDDSSSSSSSSSCDD